MLLVSMQKAHMCSKRETFHALLPLFRHVVPLNDRNCRLTMPVGKGRCAREALPHAFNSGVFKYGKSNPTTIKLIYNKSENLNEVVTLLLTARIGGIFHKQYQWLAWRVWWRAGLCYTRDYLTSGICSLIKPAAMEKMMSFHTKIHTVML